ncbi:hypothetical protein G6652_03115 [Polynucleobacter paneuropaeus]|jgi:hypothetical protein|nr:hypothetical protein [Polynucleobacter paneuropaeus]MBT8625517.1 hypothetical protein [Polynucleobacter paneuropaeus]
MHSLAALQMPFDRQTEVTIMQPVEVVQHPCHQEVTNTPNDKDPSLTHTTGCNSCTLCMAFGFSPHHLVITPNHFSMIFNVSKRISFNSHDSSGLNKPPIL